MATIVILGTASGYAGERMSWMMPKMLRLFVLSSMDTESQHVNRTICMGYYPRILTTLVEALVVAVVEEVESMRGMRMAVVVVGWYDSSKAARAISNHPSSLWADIMPVDPRNASKFSDSATR
jgi:hypothetical protein